MAQRIDYLFCINTGRSGSDYLGKILDHVVDCRAVHEPEPIGNGRAMRRYARGDAEPMRRLTQEKIKTIEKVKGVGEVYAETNHCFIKGFGWFIAEHLPAEKVGVVILKREPTKIAQSLLRVGCSPLVSGGRDWISVPSMRSPRVAPPRRMGSCLLTYQLARVVKFPFRALDYAWYRMSGKRLGYPSWLTRYELECLTWYVHETYARAEVFKQQHPGIRFYEVSIEDLNSLESVSAMLRHFGLEGKASLGDVVGRPTNLKTA